MRHDRRRRMRLAPDCRLSRQHSNPPCLAENAQEPSITSILPAATREEIPLKSRRFFFHFRVRLPKLGALKAKWTTSSRRKNCRLSASTSMSSSGKMSAAGFCVSPRKLTAAATASSCRAPALMNLRRRLPQFLQTAKPRQLNPQAIVFGVVAGGLKSSLAAQLKITATKTTRFRFASLTSGRPNLVWRFVIPAVAAAANYGHKTKI